MDINTRERKSSGTEIAELRPSMLPSLIRQAKRKGTRKSFLTGKLTVGVIPLPQPFPQNPNQHEIRKHITQTLPSMHSTRTLTLRHRTHSMPCKPIPRMVSMEPMITPQTKIKKMLHRVITSVSPPHSFSPATITATTILDVF
jgi:hypothetical protein